MGWVKTEFDSQWPDKEFIGKCGTLPMCPGSIPGRPTDAVQVL